MEFERIERDFSAMEAAELTGVSQIMQRDWRRHGYLPPSIPGKRVRFTLSEICILALAKVQTDEGKPISQAMTTARLSTSVAKVQIELCQIGVAFEGIALSTAEKREVIYGLNDRDPDGNDATRYIFFPVKNGLHTSLDGSEVDAPTCYHFHSLAQMEERVTQNWVHGSLFNLQAFAMSISFKMSEPLVTYRLKGSEV